MNKASQLRTDSPGTGQGAELLLYGPPAEPPHRCLDLLRSALAAAGVQQGADELALRCHWLYLVGPANAVADSEASARLADLLQTIPRPPARLELWAAPRPGLISPWSSKATEILQQCGLAASIEGLFAWQLQMPQWMNPTGPDMEALLKHLRPLLYDPMRQVLLTSRERGTWLAERRDGAGGTAPTDADSPLPVAELQSAEHPALAQLSAEQRLWLQQQLTGDGRKQVHPAELTMFAQVNSEHCRHWTFRAHWQDHKPQPLPSLFDWIRRTSEDGSGGFLPGLLSCYSDNAAVFTGFGRQFLAPDAQGNWGYIERRVHLAAKAETHNHPTGVSPWPGAATGVGGEIRDEVAAGRGARSKMGISGYMVSDPGWRQLSPESLPPLSPPGATFAGPRQILAEAPLGASAYGNEFGRPTLAGFLRTLEVPAALVQGSGRSGVRFWGYDKPLMLAGGLGQVLDGQEHKAEVPPGSALVVLGGPAMRVGVGGGSASSLAAGAQSAEIDFASVQRDNPEMQRRCQEVLDACWRLGENNPVLFLHDLGAGGMATAVPELLDQCAVGAELSLFEGADAERGQMLAEHGMSAEQIWCNESQERYLLAVVPERLPLLLDFCRREACPWALLGATDQHRRLRVRVEERDSSAATQAVDLPLTTLFDYRPEDERTLQPQPRTPKSAPGEGAHEGISERWQLRAEDGGLDWQLTARLAGEILAWPAVGSKAFIVQIGDRNVGGLTARDQMVGPLQLPLADCALTCASHAAGDCGGEAVALGEKAPLALLDPEASVRMAVAEALTNIAAAGVSDPAQVRLSANWMASIGDERAETELYRAVKALSDICHELKIAVPVGKDSLFMRSGAWRNGGAWVPQRHEEPTEVVSPLTLTVTAYAAVQDVRLHVTPDLVPPPPADLQERLSGKRPDAPPDTLLLHLDLGGGQRRLGGSCWQQVEAEYLQRPLGSGLLQAAEQQQQPVLAGPTPDIEPATLAAFMAAVGQLIAERKLLAYHDVSDGGLFACAFEMALAGGCGVRLYPARTGWGPGLFHEEAGALMQVRAEDVDQILTFFEDAGLTAAVVGHPIRDSRLELGAEPDGAPCDTLSMPMHGGQDAHDYPWPATRPRNLVGGGHFEHLAQAWSLHSDSVRRARGDQQQAVEREAADLATERQRLSPSTGPQLWPRRPMLVSGSDRPPVAILREQGVNGQLEMAAAFLRAGLRAQEVTMTDLQSGRVRLDQFAGLAFCGGFSYGDTLGAGRGWGRKVIHNPELRDQFQAFFARNDRFALGVCNGCQALVAMRQLIPGAEHWPDFAANGSGRYEARLVQVRIEPDAAVRSPWLEGMGEQVLLVPVSHGEGRASFADEQEPDLLQRDTDGGIALRYASSEPPTAGPSDEEADPPEAPYPLNPNGSTLGIAGLHAAGGRVLAMMPHPERAFRTIQLSWAPTSWRHDEDGTWREDSPWMQLFRNATRF